MYFAKRFKLELLRRWQVLQKLSVFKRTESESESETDDAIIAAKVNVQRVRSVSVLACIFSLLFVRRVFACGLACTAHFAGFLRSTVQSVGRVTRVTLALFLFSSVMPFWSARLAYCRVTLLFTLVLFSVCLQLTDSGSDRGRLRFRRL